MLHVEFKKWRYHMLLYFSTFCGMTLGVISPVDLKKKKKNRGQDACRPVGLRGPGLFFGCLCTQGAKGVLTYRTFTRYFDRFLLK